jgi:hypothetical protein
MLRSQQHVIEVDRQLISQIREAGMKPTQVYDFMKQFYGSTGVPFLKWIVCWGEGEDATLRRLATPTKAR